jgi:hypothetical protein
VALLPLTAADVMPAGYVVAPLVPEPSGDDRTLFAVTGETDALPAGSRLLAKAAGGRQLVEVAGFAVEPPADGRWRRIGTYAAPLRLPAGADGDLR